MTRMTFDPHKTHPINFAEFGPTRGAVDFDDVRRDRPAIRTETDFHLCLAEIAERFEPNLNPDETLDQLDALERAREGWMESDSEKQAAISLIDAVRSLAFS